MSLRHRSYSSKTNPLIDIANLIEFAFDSKEEKDFPKARKSWDYFKQVTSNLNSNISKNTSEHEKEEFRNLNQTPENKESSEQNENIYCVQEDSPTTKQDDTNILHINLNLKYEKCYKNPKIFQNHGSSTFETCISDFCSDKENAYKKHSRSPTNFLSNDRVYCKKRKSKSCLSHSANLLGHKIKSNIFNIQPFCDLSEEQISNVTLGTDDLISSLSISPTLKLLMKLYKNKVDDVHSQTDVIRCTCQTILDKIEHLPCLKHLDKKLILDKKELVAKVNDIPQSNAESLPNVKIESKENTNEMNDDKQDGKNGNTNEKEDKNKNIDKEERNDENIEDQIDGIGFKAKASDDEVNSFADHISLNSSPVPFSVCLKNFELPSSDKKVFYDDCNAWNNKKHKKKSFKKRFMRKSKKLIDKKEKNSNLSKSCGSDSDYKNDGYEGDEEKDGLLQVCSVEEVCEIIKKISESWKDKESKRNKILKEDINGNTRIKNESSEKNMKNDSWLKDSEEINPSATVNNGNINEKKSCVDNVDITTSSSKSKIAWKNFNKSINNYNISNNIMSNGKQKLIFPFYPKSSNTRQESPFQTTDEYLKKIQNQYMRACKLNAIAISIDKSKKKKRLKRKSSIKKQDPHSFGSVKYSASHSKQPPQFTHTKISVPPLTEHDDPYFPERIENPLVDKSQNKQNIKCFSSPEITTHLSKVSIKNNADFDDKNTTLRDFIYKKASESSSLGRSEATFLSGADIEKMLASFKNLNLYNIEKESVLQWKMQLIKILLQGATLEDLCRLKQQLYSLPKKSFDTLKDVPSFPRDSTCTLRSSDKCKTIKQESCKSKTSSDILKLASKRVVLKRRVKFKKAAVNLKVIEKLKSFEKTAVKLLGMYTNNQKIVNKITTKFLCSKNKTKTFTLNCRSFGNEKKNNFDWKSLEIVENILDEKTTETMTQKEKDYVGEVYSKLISRISNELEKAQIDENDSFQDHVFLVDENQNKFPLKTKIFKKEQPICNSDAVSPFVEESRVDNSIPTAKLDLFNDLKVQKVFSKSFFMKNENTLLRYVSNIFDGHPGHRTLLPALKISLDHKTFFEFNFLKKLPCECFLNSFQNMVTMSNFPRKAGMERRTKAIEAKKEEDNIEKEKEINKVPEAQVFDISKLNSFFKKKINEKEPFSNLKNFQNFNYTKENEQGNCFKKIQRTQKKNDIEVFGNSQVKSIFKVFSENSKLETTTLFNSLSWQSFHNKAPQKACRPRKDDAYNKDNVFNKTRLTKLLKNTKKLLETFNENGVEKEVVIKQREQKQNLGEMNVTSKGHSLSTIDSNSKKKSRTDSLIKNAEEKKKSFFGRSASERRNKNLNSGNAMSTTILSTKSIQKKVGGEVDENYKFFNKTNKNPYECFGQDKLKLNESKLPKKCLQLLRCLLAGNSNNVCEKRDAFKVTNLGFQKNTKNEVKNNLGKNIKNLSRKTTQKSGVHLINSTSREKRIAFNKLNDNYDYTHQIISHWETSSDEDVSKSEFHGSLSKGKKISRVGCKKKIAKTNTMKKNFKLISKETIPRKINKNCYDLSLKENSSLSHLQNYSTKHFEENFKNSLLSITSCTSSKLYLCKAPSKRSGKNTSSSFNHDNVKSKRGKNKNEVIKKEGFGLISGFNDEDVKNVHANVERLLMNEKENNKKRISNKNFIAYYIPNKQKPKNRNSFESLFDSNVNSPFTKKNHPYRLKSTSPKKKQRNVLSSKENEKNRKSCLSEKPLCEASNEDINDIQDELYGSELSSENIKALKSYLLSDNLQNVEKAFKTPNGTDNSSGKGPITKKLVWDKSSGSPIKSSSIHGLTGRVDSPIQFSSYKITENNNHSHEEWSNSTKESPSNEMLNDKWERISGVKTGLFDSSYNDTLQFARVSSSSKASKPIENSTLSKNARFELKNKYEKIVEDSKNQKFQRPRTNSKTLSVESCLEDAKTIRGQSFTSNTIKFKPPKIVLSRNFVSKPQTHSYHALNTSTNSSVHSICNTKCINTKHSSLSRNLPPSSRFSLVTNKAI